MPIEVQWKIGPKKRGNWKTPLIFTQKYEGEELYLRPRLRFTKKYPLPEYIMLGDNPNLEKAGHEECRCLAIKEINLDIDRFIDEPTVLGVRASLHSPVCSSRCSRCRAYLPWRPGLPNYDDFEEVFRQVAADLCEAWNQAVAEAMTSEEFESKQIIITPDNYLLAALKKEGLPTKFIPIRKLKIEERR